ncbi:hypothetical protein Pla108_30430 [Botrimarina colliarenosi]|uniref:Flippase-like domain-containing protein n=1 Tax=Botrimarina colliarenosi TaxID=2528001 RepID=A0A5C6A9U2_9BACT|nr:hypothetical protein Pla108_30430 [Botrimarina colliarenosi]
MTRTAVYGGLRVACGLALVGWLLWHAAAHEAFQQLWADPPRVSRLAVAWVTVLLGLALAFLRWRFVAAAVGIRMSLAETMRLGAIGFACNFVALGSVGGDVVKAALLAKNRRGQRGAAITTVLVDRALGLVGFLSYAGAAVLWTGSATAAESTPLRLLSQSILVAAVVAIAGFTAFFAPGRPVERLAAIFNRAPLVGPLSQRVGELAALYRDGWRGLLQAMGVGLLMNGVFILSFYAAATSLPVATPSLAEHFFVVPLALISGTLPISPNGLGTIEATTEFLYRAVQPSTTVGAGTLAALAHRLVMLVAGVAAAGYYYAAGGRRSEIEDATTASSSPSEEGSGTADDGEAAASRQIV